ADGPGAWWQHRHRLVMVRREPAPGRTAQLRILVRLVQVAHALRRQPTRSHRARPHAAPRLAQLPRSAVASALAARRLRERARQAPAGVTARALANTPIPFDAPRRFPYRSQPVLRQSA